MPDELYRAVKERDLPASELLQEAVEAELRRQQLNEWALGYLDELVAEVGKPSARERARAATMARRCTAARSQNGGGLPRHTSYPPKWLPNPA
ncbi:MAG: hypothetical protein ACRDRT_01115 [Pseudonocardiaceae bacterium]